MAHATDVLRYAPYEEAQDARRRGTESVDHWPPLYTTLFVLAASLALWSLLAGAVWALVGWILG